MKNFLLLIAFVAFSVCYGQIKFENGYFIKNNGEKVECLIKNQDWFTTPKLIEYKTSETSLVEKIELDYLSSFKIYDTPHYYKRIKVNIDKDVKEYYNPSLQTVVLRVVLEGKATLYRESEYMFFYNIDGSEVKQLIYGKYGENVIKENKSFQSELFNNLKCEDVSVKEIRALTYKEKSLLNLFRKYNECVKSDYIDLTKNKTEMKLRYKLIGGLNYNSTNKLNIDFTDVTNNDKTLESKSSSKSANIIIGGELEVLLPFNKNKWAFFIAPNYQSHSGSYTKTHNNVMGQKVSVSTVGGSGSVTLSYDVKVDASYEYSYIELPIGLRRYFDFNEVSSWYIDVFYGFNINVKKPYENVEYEQFRPMPELYPLNLNMDEEKVSTSIRLGVGYNYKDYSFSLNYYLKKRLLNSNFESYSFIVSYKLFEK